MKILFTQENHQKGEDFSISKDFKFCNSRKKIIKKRKRKSADQLTLLSQEFKNSLDWDKETMNYLAKKTGLSEAQIYKWSWDQKKKLQGLEKLRSQKMVHLSEIFNKLPETPSFNRSKIGQDCIDTNFLGCFEVINLRNIDFEMYNIQKKYRGCMEGFAVNKNLIPCFENCLQERSGLDGR